MVRAARRRQLAVAVPTIDGRVQVAEIYIVCRAYDYEGSSAMVAFSKREDADAFQKLCTEYQAKKPQFPADEEGEAAYDAYCKKDERWRKKHPGGEFASSADSFHVEAVELR